MNRIGMIVTGALLALRVASSTLFVVDQRQFAVLYALGEIKEVMVQPGLKFKLPPPFQNVVFLDRRIQSLDSPETRPVFTAEKTSLVIDWLIKWRITDPRQFIRNNGADIRNAEAYRDAQKIKGEGDAKASALYAEAFGRDPAFAQFYRQLDAYRASFRNKTDVMVLEPTSEFFRAMRGTGQAASAPAAPARAK